MPTVSAPHAPLPWSRRPWLGVLSRSCAAIFGGYALASAGALLLAVALPTPSQAVMTGMMVGILLGAGAALWAFATATAWRAWAGIALPSALMLALAQLPWHAA